MLLSFFIISLCFPFIKIIDYIIFSKSKFIIDLKIYLNYKLYNESYCDTKWYDLKIGSITNNKIMYYNRL